MVPTAFYKTRVSGPCMRSYNVLNDRILNPDFMKPCRLHTHATCEQPTVAHPSAPVGVITLPSFALLRLFGVEPPMPSMHRSSAALSTCAAGMHRMAGLWAPSRRSMFDQSTPRRPVQEVQLPDTTASSGSTDIWENHKLILSNPRQEYYVSGPTAPYNAWVIHLEKTPSE